MTEQPAAQLYCPKCPGVLKEVEVDGIKVEICWICEGIWFDSGELQKVIQNDTRNLNLDHLGQADMDGKELAELKTKINEIIGPCPRCSDDTLLQKEHYPPNKKLEIDVCPHGHGLWLDGGEIQLLRNRTLANVLHAWDHFMSWVEIELFSRPAKKVKRRDR